jgi:hypothetical protein
MLINANKASAASQKAAEKANFCGRNATYLFDLATSSAAEAFQASESLKTYEASVFTEAEYMAEEAASAKSFQLYGFHLLRTKKAFGYYTLLNKANEASKVSAEDFKSSTKAYEDHVVALNVYEHLAAALEAATSAYEESSAYKADKSIAAKKAAATASFHAEQAKKAGDYAIYSIDA